ncbi:MAG: hypothetical protein ACXVA9_01940 [Bdellovibrionales bacterium]
MQFFSSMIFLASFIFAPNLSHAGKTLNVKQLAECQAALEAESVKWKTNAFIRLAKSFGRDLEFANILPKDLPPIFSQDGTKIRLVYENQIMGVRITNEALGFSEFMPARPVEFISHTKSRNLNSGGPRYSKMGHAIFPLMDVPPHSRLALLVKVDIFQAARTELILESAWTPREGEIKNSWFDSKGQLVEFERLGSFAK